MSIFNKIKDVIQVADYKVPQEFNSCGWRSRFREIELWADGNPWENPTPDPKELKLCVSELFQAIHMAHEGFKFCAEKNGTKEALNAANGIATILGE